MLFRSVQLGEMTSAHKIEMDQAASERNDLEQEMELLRKEVTKAEEDAEVSRKLAEQASNRLAAWKVEFAKVENNMTGELFLVLP